MTKPSNLKVSNSSLSSYMDFEFWMNEIHKKSLSIKNKNLFLKGLIDHPEWVNQRGFSQKTLLMNASSLGHTEVVKTLIQAGADVNMQDQWAFSALIYAAAASQRKLEMGVVNELIQAGANLNLQNENGWTALMFASLHEKVELVQALIKAGANLNLRDKRGGTALMRVADLGHLELVKSLIEAGADLNLQCNEGLTALMMASKYGHLDVVKELIQQGADLMIKNKRHQTALEVAKEESDGTIVCYLEACYSQQALSQSISKETSVTIQSDETHPMIPSKGFRL